MKSFLSLFLTISLQILLFPFVSPSAVCDERLLLMELKQDLDDNGVLDCLRVIQPPHSYIESIDERNKRIAAQWDSACSFEADYDWMKSLREIHGISNLVDDTGDIVDKDFPDQADMCEIVRAAIAAGKFNKISNELTNINSKILDLIDCPGSQDQSEICAVTGGSFFQNDTWYILLDGMGLAIDGKPHFVLAPVESSMPDIPLAQKELIKKVEEGVGDTSLVNNFKKQLKANKGMLSGALDKIKGLIQSMTIGGKTQSIIIPNSEKAAIFENDVNGATQTVNTNRWNPFGNALIKPVVSEEKVLVVVGDATVNFERNVPSHFVGKLLLDGTEQRDSRTLQGNYIIDSLNMGFVSKLSKGDHKVHMEYRSPSPLTGQLNNPETVWQDNRYLGGLVLNGNLKFFRNNYLPSLQLNKATVWTKLDALKVKFPLENDRPVLFFYNLACSGEVSLGARLTVDGKEILSTYKRVSPAPYAGLFGMGARILSQGEHLVQLEYEAGAVTSINPGGSDWESAGVSVVELPITSVIHEKSLETATNISPKAWTLLGSLQYELNIEREKNCLVYYAATFTMSKGNAAVYFRVQDNMKEIVKSRAASSNGNIAGVSNQFLLNLPVGKHTLELQYYTGETNAKWKIDPTDTFQAASFNIIEFEADNANQAS